MEFRALASMRLCSILLLGCVITRALANVQQLSGTYKGTLKTKLLRMVPEATYAPTTPPTTAAAPTAAPTPSRRAADRRGVRIVCVANPVETEIEIFFDGTAGLMYYYNAMTQATIGGNNMVVEEVKTEASAISWVDGSLGLASVGGDGSTTTCVRVLLETWNTSTVNANTSTGNTPGVVETRMYYSLTNALSQRYPECDKATKYQYSRCSLSGVAEYTVAAQLTMLTGSEADAVKAKHGWVEGAAQSFCSANQKPFEHFGPMDCHAEEEETAIPGFVYVAAVIVGLVLGLGLLVLLSQWCIQKFGKSRSFWCILCIFSYRTCYAEHANGPIEFGDDDEVAVQMQPAKVKPHLYKPGWACKYGEGANWSKYAS